MQKAQEVFSVSERRVCRAIGQPRSTQRYQGRKRQDEGLLEEQVVALANQYGRYGYRRITALLRMTGWHVNHKRVVSVLGLQCTSNPHPGGPEVLTNHVPVILTHDVPPGMLTIGLSS